jgi:thiol-disulfide isomerase/thioredoxin
MGRMMFRKVALFVLLFAGLSCSAFAGIVQDVRTALAQKNFSQAEAEMQSYRSHLGVTPEYLEALSWMARQALSENQLTIADTYAQQVEAMARPQLARRKLDAEPHLPLALGAAIEVRAQVLAARDQHAAAVTLLRRDMALYGNTSLRPRLQKNLNMLSLTGRLAPPLRSTPHLGTQPVPALQHSPTLMFFWAHWCVDCKAEGPVIAQLAAEFAPKGLAVIAPTQFYGYAAQGEDATPQQEMAYIDAVWQHYYPDLQKVPVPVNKANFDNYGASTTPTLVLVDRKGRVAMYHPGVMPYDQLRAEIEKLLAH